MKTKILIILIVLIGLGAGGFFIGRHYLVSPYIETPPEYGPLIDFSKDVTQHQYGPADRNIFYLAIPEKDKELKKTKLVIWVHGATFIKGDPFEDMKNYGNFFFKRGYAVASIGGRICPDVKWRVVVEDFGRGIKAVLDELKNQGYEVEDVTYAGLSAGPTIGALLLYSDKHPSISGVDRFISFSAVFNPDAVMNITDESSSNELQEVSASCEMGTIYNVLSFQDTKKSEAPALLIEGESDVYDGFAYSKKSHIEYFADKLKKQEVYAEILWVRDKDLEKHPDYYYPHEEGCGHMCPLNLLMLGDEKITRAVETFMEEKP